MRIGENRHTGKRRCTQKKGEKNRQRQEVEIETWQSRSVTIAPYPGCSFPHHCGPCSPTRHHSASAEGYSEHDSGRGTRPPGTPSHSQSDERETSGIIESVPYSDAVSCNQRKTQTLNDSCFNLDWSVIWKKKTAPSPRNYCKLWSCTA